MLMIDEETRKRRPVIRCERCRRPIEHGEEGRVVWERRTRPVPAYSEVRIVHRGCLEGYADEAAFDVESMELGTFVRDLALNLRASEPEG